MKYHSKNKLIVALSACFLGSFSIQGMAEEAADPPDTSDWACKLCAISGGWFGDWELGLIYVDRASLKFADYRGLDDDGFYLKADGDARYRDERGYYFDFYGQNLGLDSRNLEMRGGKQGSYELRAGYSEIPRYLGYGTVTPYQGVGTDTLVLPEDWNINNGDSFMVPTSLESKRKTLDAGGTFKLGSAWKIIAEYERQRRDGTIGFSGGVFPFNGAIFPAPLDYTTNRFDVGLEYTGNRGQARVEYSGSDFDNGANTLTWDSPYNLGYVTDYSRSALAPDNKYHQISLAGAFRFSPRFRVSGKAYWGKAKQNETFLPYSTNPRYSDLELPRPSLDGKLDTTMYNLSGGMYARLAKGFGVTAEYKKDKRDNKSPMDSYTPVMMEWIETGPFSNRPYSYDRQHGKVELRYRSVHNFRLNGGYKRATIKRTYQEVRKNTEDSFWGEVQVLPSAWLDARFKYEVLDRDSTTHEQQGNYGRDEHPLMRKYNMADRERKRLTAEFNLTPVERLAVNLSYYRTNDDYDNSTVGLTEGKETSANVDINYAIGKNATAYGFYSRERIKSQIDGSPNVSTGVWSSFTDDKISTWGLGLSSQAGEKTTYGFDYVRSNADGKILTQTVAGEPPFPVLNSKLENFRIYLNHKLNDRWGLGLNAYREEYDSSDWYVDGFGPLDVDGLMSMGGISPNYTVTVVSLFATLTF